MERKIKLIWDFRGPAAGKTAEHHEKHLKEYIALEDIDLNITGHHYLGDLHSYAFMVIGEGQLAKVRDSLRPHRGEIYEE